MTDSNESQPQPEGVATPVAQTELPAEPVSTQPAEETAPVATEQPEQAEQTEGAAAESEPTRPVSTQPAEETAPAEDSTPTEETAAPAEDTTAAADTATADVPEPAAEADEAAAEPAEDTTTAEADEPAAEPAEAPRPSPASIPKPSAIPTPAALAKAVPHPPAAPAVPVITTDHSASAAFGRVDDNGTVFVRTKEGEKEVGSYPGATADEALTYFARKYDELYASAVLLEQRLSQPEVPSKDVAEALKVLTGQVAEAAVVGDLEALATKLDEIQSGVAAKRTVEQQHRAEARTAATAERERIVAEAESIAEQPESRIQWKQSGARMRELLDEWKAHQRSATRLDRDTETKLWQRFSAARNRFDKARRTHFAGLDASHAEAKGAKERLVAEAEKLSTSTDWAATAGAFKRLMDDWRRAGRASRTDDDRLWARFKAAQDAFFAAKDAVVAAEEEQYRGNLTVKEALLVEAEALLPVTDLERTKAQLRAIQDKWDAAGKVPRADMDRIEKAMRRVEQTVRDAEDKKWHSTNPEAAARAQGMVEQLERAVADLKDDLAKAEASGNANKVKKAKDALEARQAWLDQARAGVREFGG
ncbi:DUF349 domain-containing protein [Intrasporangium calvum]|uniref:DUF349 domain-containing protein n=1 Tax=Intrasporangium calvum TaxID=53358 RepID=A0ABT5GCS7_9MICO|nr:DUF349 domain-containing protein [Intrasporangium calvum]MDC5695685.1 DUF349 domain-containing protein [Intrasporangium calvum]